MHDVFLSWAVAVDFGAVAEEGGAVDCGVKCWACNVTLKRNSPPPPPSHFPSTQSEPLAPARKAAAIFCVFSNCFSCILNEYHVSNQTKRTLEHSNAKANQLIASVYALGHKLRVAAHVFALRNLQRPARRCMADSLRLHVAGLWLLAAESAAVVLLRRGAEGMLKARRTRR